jgi:hypothetical protein
MAPSFGQWAGYAAGVALAPFTATASFIRQARVFHPHGVVLQGTARVLPAASPFGELGDRLAGKVIVRFSSAWWKDREWIDILGCALRFSEANDFHGQARHSDQDLLLATVRHPFTLPFAPWTTRVSDYLANDYFGVSPFVGPNNPRLFFRLKPLRVGVPGESSRERKLNGALAVGPITMQLQARTGRFSGVYEDVVVIDLVERAQLDPAFSFDPFQNGRGLKPVGFVHALRSAVYAASRTGRQRAEPIVAL